MLKANDKLFALLSILLLCAAWAGGYYRSGSQVSDQLKQLDSEIVSLEKVSDTLYLGHYEGESTAPAMIAIEEYPGYGGPMKVAVVVKDRVVETTAVLHSNDTSTYLAEVVNKGVLKDFVGRSIEEETAVDAVSGATLSSRAVINGAEHGMNEIGAAYYDRPLSEKRSPLPFGVKDGVIIFFFVAALLLPKVKGVWFTRLRWGLMLLSIGSIGFIFASQFTIATDITFLSGVWLHGLASYTSLICLLLAVTIFLFTRKNVFCTYICPFGATQECLATITKCKAPDTKNAFVKWTPRVFLLLALMGGLYFRNPSAFSYEPFGVFFSVIGSQVLFVLAILIILSSLALKRSWCNLFCPVTGMYSFLRFIRRWIMPAKRVDVS
jgi:uncharacterized protein with FMN-binding domain